MIAMAIYRGGQRIETYGIHMSTGVEYRAQKPSCEFWFGYALGAGIEVEIHREFENGIGTALFETRTREIYGWYEPQEQVWERVFGNEK